MKKQQKVYQDEFKRMAVELTYAKGTIKAAADDLGLEPSLLAKWRRDPRYNQQAAPVSSPGRGAIDLEIENRRLQRALREMTMERDILKKAVHIFSKSDRNDSGL